MVVPINKTCDFIRAHGLGCNERFQAQVFILRSCNMGHAYTAGHSSQPTRRRGRCEIYADALANARPHEILVMQGIVVHQTFPTSYRHFTMESIGH